MARAAVDGADGPASRRARLRDRLGAADVAALVVAGRANLRYLTGFTGSAGLLVLDPDPPDLLLTDGRYRHQAGREVDAGVAIDIVQELGPALRDALSRDGTRRVAFEAEHTSVATWDEWRADGGPDLIPVRGWVEELRVVKEPGEVDAIRRAAALADAAFEWLLAEIRPGVAERELAAALDHRLASLGSEGPPFETIVAAGPRAALPHARPGGRAVARGDVVLVDFGATVDGYRSDLTRTVACGDPGREMHEVYEVVLAAQTAAIEGVTAGMTGREADAVARNVIERAGYGDAFGHGLGHGIGLEVHERPRLSRTNGDPLPAGAVVTVEPGVYIPNSGGVRIEDDVILTPRGVHVLTRAPKQALIVL